MKVQSQQKYIFKQSLYHISLASVIVMIIWVAYAIYFSYGQGSQNLEETNIDKNVEPFSPNLHLETAQSLNGRTALDPSLLNNFQPSSTPQPQSSPPPRQSSSSSATLTNPL